MGKYLESRAKRQTLDASRALMALRPDMARLRTADGEQPVPLEQIDLGDNVLIQPGESLPVSRQPGDAVSAGAMNQDGMLVVETIAVGHDTMLARIVRLVESAQTSKAPIQRLSSAWWTGSVRFLCQLCY